jgi:hypothetical protein
MTIDEQTSLLRRYGVFGVDQYQKKLRDNERNPGRLADLSCEGEAAMMFRKRGWEVTMRDSPDLQLVFGSEVVYAEVKHFVEKEEDRLNDQMMTSAPGQFVRCEQPSATRGGLGWEQIVAVAIRKAEIGQFLDGVANILVIVSDSETLHVMTKSAMNEYDEIAEASANRLLRRLSGIMLVSPLGPSVTFCRSSTAAVPLSFSLEAMLGDLQRV